MRNLEAVELGLREAVFRDLCAVLEELLNDPALPIAEDYSRPGEKCHTGRPKEFLSLFGPVPLSRNYYHWEARQEGRAPLDQALGLWAGYSPGVLRVLCRLAARFPFEVAASEFKAYCGLEVEGRQIQRIAQQMGPLVRQAVTGRSAVVESAVFDQECRRNCEHDCDGSAAPLGGECRQRRLFPSLDPAPIE